MKMPKGIKPIEDDIGRKVVYRTAPNYEPEEGVITSIGRIGNVFVRYGVGATSASTDCGDLDWMIGGDRIDPRDPDPTREGIFRNHNCYRCRSGELPCIKGKGNERNCDTLRARND